MIYCTIFDKNYLSKAMTMARSIGQFGEAELHCLCLDNESFDILLKKPNDFISKNVRLYFYNVNQLEAHFPDIKKARNLPVGSYGDQHSAFCWAMTPWFIWYMLHGNSDEIMYVDSDIFFYKSPELILKDCQGYDVGLHTHRFSSFDIRKQNVGKYNVGVVFFRRSSMGLRICEQWKNWVLDPTNKYFDLYGQCGDQGYLTAFEIEFDMKHIRIFDENPELLHGAPWCCNDLLDKEIAFYHFSHFNIKNGKWRSSYNGEWRPELQPSVFGIYDNYHSEIKKSEKCLIS